jgi:outer membrane protein assembly factor BamB
MRVLEQWPRLRLIALLCAAVAVGGGTSANAADAKPAPTTKKSWASFRNGLLQQGIAGSKLPEKLELLWKKPTEHGVVATAAIVGEYVYVPALSGLLFCFDRKTGKEIWRYRSIADPKEFAPGMVSAPTVTADTVYVGDEDGVLHALDRATGKKRWLFKTGAKIPGGAQVVDGKVIFGSYDSFLYCVDAKKGTLIWKFQTMDRINCAPAIAGDFTFVAGCDMHLRRINIKTQKQVTDFDLKAFLIASPAIMGDYLYVGTQKGEVVSYNWKTDKIQWRYGDLEKGTEVRASAAVTDKYVIVGMHDKMLHCIDRKTGKGIWTARTRAQINSSAVIVGDRVFFGCEDRNVYEVRLSDGKQLWKFNAGHGVSAGPAVGEGVLVFGGADAGGFIYCFGKKE